MFIYYTISLSPPSCRPPIRLNSEKKKQPEKFRQKVSSNLLKIAEQVAYG